MSLAPHLKFSSRLDGVHESATLKLNAQVQAMKAKGIDVMNLTAGEPDFPVPEPAKRAVRIALDENRSKYTPSPGIPELRELVAAKTNVQQRAACTERPWTAADVIVTNGGKQALFNTFLALLNPGDEVVIPSPFWLSYPDMVRIAGGTPRIVDCPRAAGFKMTPAQLEAALTPRTKAVIFNSPSNPTGAMYSRAEYAALGKVLERFPAVWAVSDEIYDRIVFGKDGFCSFLDAAPQLRDRTVTVNGMSKSAAMTGWRVGWSVAGPEITQAMNTIQGQSTSGINALAQWASVAALKLPELDFRSQVTSFRRRRDLTLEILAKAPKLEVSAPEGAFYAFVGVGRLPAPLSDSFVFAERLLKEAQVAVVPGAPFGDAASFRLSFATDEKSLREGCERIARFSQ
jgi:aspartate aminotransferase